MNVVVHRLWKLVLSIIGVVRNILKRIICRGRSRKLSGDVLPFTNNQTHKLEVPVSNNEANFQSWDGWEDNSFKNTNSNQIQNSNVSHRYNHNDANTSDDVPDVDFFQGMQPEFKRATKIMIKKKNDDAASSNKFSVSSDIPFQIQWTLATGSDLEAWDEGGDAWCEEAMEDLSNEAMAAEREKRNLERNQRSAENHKKKLERDNTRLHKQNGPLLNAVKLS